MMADMQHGRLFEYIQYRSGDQYCSREITISYLPVTVKAWWPEEDGVGIMEANMAAPAPGCVTFALSKSTRSHRYI